MIKNSIAKASEKWEKIIFEFLTELYSDKWLPSHDITHHRRVWRNAFEFCNKMPAGLAEDGTFYEKLIICCYFHDTGLLTEPGEYHGKESRKICESFLMKNKDRINFNIDDLLFAIENHDEKKYFAEIKGKNLLLEILTVADDLDAFGAIGLYRYIEIYLLRNLPIESIAQRILNNAIQRFDNVKIITSKYNVSTDHYFTLFLILKSLLEINFFNDDPIILFGWINENIIKHKQDPFIVFRNLNTREIQSERIRDFIDKFNGQAEQL